MLLEKRAAFVTGGGGLIGSQIAAVLAREGAKVAVADIDHVRAQATTEMLQAAGHVAVVVTGDVSARTNVDRMAEEAEQALGPVDILVNAHGIFPNCLLLEVDVDEWDSVFAVNVRGTMLTCQRFGNEWVTDGIHGAIVNISSAAAPSARIGGAHYAGSKAAVNLLTHALAIELGPHGIRVNAVAPGLVLDEVMTEPRADTHPYFAMELHSTPMRRTGSPKDIAETVAFLASHRSSWTTGAIVEVTGGSHCGRPHVPLTRDLD